MTAGELFRDAILKHFRDARHGAMGHARTLIATEEVHALHVLEHLVEKLSKAEREVFLLGECLLAGVDP